MGFLVFECDEQVFKTCELKNAFNYMIFQFRFLKFDDILELVFLVSFGGGAIEGEFIETKGFVKVKPLEYDKLGFVEVRLQVPYIIIIYIELLSEDCLSVLVE